MINVTATSCMLLLLIFSENMESGKQTTEKMAASYTITYIVGIVVSIFCTSSVFGWLRSKPINSQIRQINVPIYDFFAQFYSRGQNSLETRKLLSLAITFHQNAWFG